ncbi:MAG: hypothetical protein NVSMB31_03620 [Vulcanimicrobiaceae bacterium]
MVNLIVDLRDEKFSPAALAQYYASIADAKFSYVQTERAGDSALAWIDQEFGGAWSSEAFAGQSIVATKEREFAGFASFEPRGLAYSWLRSYQRRNEVGVFGPFGVKPQFRGTVLGRNLLLAALTRLRLIGYTYALIPAVGTDGLITYYAKHAGATVAEEVELDRFAQSKIRTTVLASGNGSNFQAVADVVAAGNLPLEITSLIANNSNAYALERAEKAAITTRVVVEWDRSVESRDTYDARLLQAVEQTDPQLVLLLGWMHVLSKPFVSAFPDMINIHPAFLPLDQTRDSVGMPDGATIRAYRGAHAIRDALAAKAPWVGASSHRVSFDTDRGSVLIRKPLAVVEGDDESLIMERLRPIEHAVLLGGIRRWLYER